MVGQRVKELRELRGMTVRQLAQQADLAQAHVWMVEAGKRSNPSAVTIAKIAKALGCRVEDLVSVRIRPAA